MSTISRYVIHIFGILTEILTAGNIEVCKDVMAMQNAGDIRIS